MENNLTTLSASITDRGLSEKRAQNEDSFIDFGEHGIFAVADGVGGAQAGDVASQMAVEIIGEAFVNRTPSFDAEDTMRRAIEQANSAIYQMSSELPSLSSMATTVVALYVNGDVATIGHVGDSRVYRVDRGGTLEQVTADHSVVEEEVRAGRLTPEQALNHPSRNIISRALGAESTVDVDLKTIMVGEGSTFLLCSDGITKHVSDAEIAVLLGSGADLEMICGRLKELCYARGAEDNLTAVTVRVAEQQAEAYDVVDDDGSAPVIAAEEEDTIATARSPFDSMAAEDVVEPSSEPADALHAAADDADAQAYLKHQTPLVEEPADISGYTSSSVVVPAAEPAPDKYRSHSTAPLAERAPATSSSGVLTSVVMLLLGGILGAAVMYFLWPSAVSEPQAEAPAITEMKSTNTPLTAFEEGRRIVDADPERYITANAASLQDAEDYFLMGRAFLLTGKQWEAKRAFTEAKNRLAQADPANAKTLAAEIAMALAIIESPSASEGFKKELGGGSATPANTTPRANTAPANAANSISAAPTANRTATVTRPASARPLATSGDSRPRQVAANGSAAARPVR